MMKFDPTSISIQSLPSVPLEQRDRLPKHPGIYFAVDSLGNVQYIGRSVNICQRWKSHHRQPDLDACQGVQIHHLEISSPELLPEVEAALIEWFEPRLNGRREAGLKYPRSRTSRLADDVWMAGEAIARYFRMGATRDGFETAIRSYVSRLAESDPHFAEIWTAVKKEGIDDTNK
jgi:hypothetical protein